MGFVRSPSGVDKGRCLVMVPALKCHIYPLLFHFYFPCFRHMLDNRSRMAADVSIFSMWGSASPSEHELIFAYFCRVMIFEIRDRRARFSWACHNNGGSTQRPRRFSTPCCPWRESRAWRKFAKSWACAAWWKPEEKALENCGKSQEARWSNGI